mgnify:CR=1 FL=1
MDDAFVLLAAWRRTPTSMTVPERLGHTYAEAAVSITITSLTNFISFMIGIITPFPSVSVLTYSFTRSVSQSVQKLLQTCVSSWLVEVYLYL